MLFSGVHFYWNTIDDTVSWLPPDHPNAVISKSAATLRREMEALQTDTDDKIDNVQEEMVFDMRNVSFAPVFFIFRSIIIVIFSAETGSAHGP